MKLLTLHENINSTDEALKILLLNRGYTPEELKKAYRKAAMQHHPDRGGTHELMKDVNAAYELLSKRINRTDADDFIKRTDIEIKQSGTYKGGKGTFSTQADWEQYMKDSGRDEMLKNIKASMARSGDVYEMPGEMLNRRAGEDGLLTPLSLVLRTLDIKDYQFIAPHRIKLLKPLPYDMSKLSKDIGEFGKKLESSGIMKIANVQWPGWGNNRWNILIRIPALSSEYNPIGFTLEYGNFTFDKQTRTFNQLDAELMTLSYEEDEKKIASYLMSLK